MAIPCISALRQLHALLDWLCTESTPCVDAAGDAVHYIKEASSLPSLRALALQWSQVCAKHGKMSLEGWSD